MQLFNCKMETKSDMKNMTIWNIARACKGHLAVPAGKHTGTCPAAGMAVIRGYSRKEAAGIVIDSRTGRYFCGNPRRTGGWASVYPGSF